MYGGNDNAMAWHREMKGDTREEVEERGRRGELVTLSGPPVKPPSGKCQVTGRDSPPHYPSPFSLFLFSLISSRYCYCRTFVLADFPFLVHFHKSLPVITHPPMCCQFLCHWQLSRSLVGT